MENKGMSNSVQVFVSQSIRHVLNVKWPDKI